MPTCSDLSETAHLLLAHLTRTRKRRSGVADMVKGDLDQWAAVLPVSREDLRTALDDVGPEEDGGLGFLRRDQHGRLLLWLACECRPNLGQTSPEDAGKPGARRRHSPGRRGVLNSLREYDPSRPAGASDECVTEDSTPLQGSRKAPRPRPIDPAAEFDPSPEPVPSAYDLADFFSRRITAVAAKERIPLVPGSIAMGALGKHIRRMLAEGVPAQEVRDMIIDFARDYRRYHKDGVDPARVFLAHRRRLFAEQRNRSMIMTERNYSKYMAEAKAKGKRIHTADDILRRKNT